MTIGDRIKEIRERNNIFQIELANKIGVSKQTMYKYENNIIENIPLDKIVLIANELHVSPVYLVGWEEHIAEETELEKGYDLLYQAFKKLNKKGKREAIKRVQELVQLSCYIKEGMKSEFADEVAIIEPFNKDRLNQSNLFNDSVAAKEYLSSQSFLAALKNGDEPLSDIDILNIANVISKDKE